MNKHSLQQNKSDKIHCKVITFKFNKVNDKDILDKLDSVPNKQGYIKSLIRKDLENK